MKHTDPTRWEVYWVLSRLNVDWTDTLQSLLTDHRGQPENLLCISGCKPMHGIRIGLTHVARQVSEDSLLPGWRVSLPDVHWKSLLLSGFMSLTCGL
jgi:hypothetical protein